MKRKKIYLFTILVLIFTFLINKNYYLNSKSAELISFIRMKFVTQGIKSQVINDIAYYCSDNGVDNTNYIKMYISQGEVDESKYFGQTNKHPLNIVTLKEKSFSKILNVNPDVYISGFDGRTIYLNDETLSPSVIVHEYTHYKMNAFCYDNGINILKVPLWFKEGVAEYISSPFYDNKYKNSKLSIVEPFRNLNTLKNANKAISNGFDVYMQSYFAIKEIVKLKGQNSIKDILISSKSKEFYNSLEQELGMNISTFESRLLNSNRK